MPGIRLARDGSKRGVVGLQLGAVAEKKLCSLPLALREIVDHNTEWYDGENSRSRHFSLDAILRIVRESYELGVCRG